MKLNLALLTVFAAILVVSGFSTGNGPTERNRHQIHKQRQTSVDRNALKSSTTEVRFQGGEWTGYLSCDLQGVGSDCDLSIHEQGYRIDVSKHKPNMEVMQGCHQGVNSIALTIHNFSYNDVQDYTCLLNDAGQFVTESAWLFAYPHLDASVPQNAKVGDEVTFTCNSYAGTPLYWVMPGEAALRTDYQITNSGDGINSTTTLTFKLLDDDNFGEFWCCSDMTSSQETIIPCVLYTVEFETQLQLGNTQYYPEESSQWEIICQFQGYPDPEPVVWQQCDTVGRCQNMVGLDQPNALLHMVTSNLTIPHSESYNYTCSSGNKFGSLLGTFQPVTNYFAPYAEVTSKISYYSSEGYAFRISCTVHANPLPDMFWSTQNFWSQSNGSLTIRQGDPGRYQVVNSITGINTFDSTLIIDPYDVETDLGTFACIATSPYGYYMAETEAELAPDDVQLYVCGGPYHVIDETVMVVFSAYGFPPVQHDISVVADNDISYRLDEQYETTTGINVVRITFKASAENPHVQITASAFLPYIYFMNKLTTDAYISEGPISTPVPPEPQPYCK